MKNLLLLLALLITTSTVFAQLFVRPNPTSSTDSYVFVNDEILFVEQDVNLEINGAGDTEASIYLRNGGQLIQGASAINNNGTGQLSVYQNAPNDDAWDYTYWCSPIGNPAGGAGNTNFGITKIYDVDAGTHLTKSNLIGTTTSRNGWMGDGTSTNPLTISTRWTYSHETPGSEAESHYQRIYSGNNVTPGFGFIMKGVNSGASSDGGANNHDQNYDFRGRPNNGTFSIPVEDTSDAFGNPYWTLTGNPYPSALDLAMVVNTNAMVNSIYFWDEDRNIDGHTYALNRAGFGTWVPAGGAGLPGGGTAGVYTPPPFIEWDASGGNGGGGTGGTGATYERRFSPIGQGFMLVGLGNNDGNMSNATIDNSMRVFVKEGAGDNSEFRSPENINAEIGAVPTNPEPVIERWPELRFSTSFGDSHSRQMVLLFNDDATDFYDHGMDALHPMDARRGEAYFPIGQDNNIKKYVIQTVPFSFDKKVPLNFKLTREYTINVTLLEKINVFGSVYLWDSQEDIYRELTEVISSGGIEADNSFLLPAGHYQNRFYIVFKNRREAMASSEGTISAENTRASINFFQNNPYKQLEILNPEGYDIKNTQVFDMLGKLVVDKSNLGDDRKLTISTANLADGVYIVKLLTTDNVNIDYKMIIKNN